MDPKPPSDRMFLAPGRGDVSAVKLPGRESLPPLDEHVVTPETHEELLRGRRIDTMGSLPEHGDPHCNLDYLVRAHVAPGYVPSSDMLTRQSLASNFATDTSVRREGVNAATNERFLEELAFEVVNTQSRAEITEKAQDLAARGVRRVFALFVRKRQLCEWVAGAWAPFHLDDEITDVCLGTALPVRAMLDAAAADDAVVKALVAKGNPEIARLRTQSEAVGEARGEARGEAAGMSPLVRQFERRLQRSLVAEERELLRTRLRTLGPERVGDVVLDLEPAALGRWLADPAAE